MGETCKGAKNELRAVVGNKAGVVGSLVIVKTMHYLKLLQQNYDGYTACFMDRQILVI